MTFEKLEHSQVKASFEVTAEEFSVALDEAFKILNDNEIKIMKLRYYNSLTQSKTAEILNMSQVQVSRAEKKILLKLRRYLQ